MTDIAGAARRASDSATMEVLARLGLSARAFVYVVIGWLAVQIALGHGRQQANQRGAIAAVAHHAFGKFWLWVLAVGFAGYAVWRLSEAVFGAAAEGRKTGPRLQSMVRGVMYSALCLTTVSFLLSNAQAQQGQAQQQETTTAKGA